jgi:hypothetical protein
VDETSKIELHLGQVHLIERNQNYAGVRTGLCVFTRRGHQMIKQAA